MPSNRTRLDGPRAQIPPEIRSDAGLEGAEPDVWIRASRETLHRTCPGGMHFPTFPCGLFASPSYLYHSRPLSRPCAQPDHRGSERGLLKAYDDGTGKHPWPATFDVFPANPDDPAATGSGWSAVTRV